MIEYDDRRNELIKKHPEILGGRGGWPSVGNGWLPIIDELCTKLEQHGDEIPTAAQIKEKFGGLRFYVDGATQEHYDLIRQAEEKSFHTCEVCGKPGTLGGIGWLKTACREHQVNAR